jgi:DnaJ-domain-containing protein 1
MDEDFLIAQMEIREALSEVSSKDDPLAELDSINAEIKSKTNAMSEAFSQSYINNKLDDAKELIRKMQFLKKSKDEVDQLSASIEDRLY